MESRISLIQGLAWVKRTHECLKNLQTFSGLLEGSESLIQFTHGKAKQQADWENVELRQQHGEALLAVATLRVILKKHFLTRLPKQGLPS